MRWRGSPRTFLMMLAAVLALSLLPSLSGCVSSSSTLERVMSAIGGSAPPLSEDAARELRRFDDIYTTYAEASSSRDRLDYFGFAFKRVRANYVHQADDKALIDEAIKGVVEKEPKPTPGSLKPALLVEDALHAMLASLDPHSSYMNADEFRESFVQTKGEFGGLGIQVTMEDGLVKVIAPIEDTPAARAGMKSGDLISHVDGEPIKGRKLSEAVRRMRGKPGTDIRLTVLRGDAPAFDVSLTRAIIQVKSVRWHSEGDVGYIRITRFSEKTEAGLTAAMAALRAELGQRMAGVIVDLRNNPGGLLDQSLIVADAFMEEGEIVSVRGRTAESYRAFKAKAGDLAAGLPLVVLINAGSASASEIVAGALKHHRRATLMGATTFGKGSVQTIMPLPVDGALRLTTALYYTPDGETIQARGVAPDIRIEAVESDPDKPKRKREKDLPGALPEVGHASAGSLPTVKETACPAIGERKDRPLGCALAYIRAGSTSKFLALVNTGAPS